MNLANAVICICIRIKKRHIETYFHIVVHWQYYSLILTIVIILTVVDDETLDSGHPNNWNCIIFLPS